jgi:nitroreductase
MELNEVMRTTFSARAFTSEPIPDATLYRILDNARFAPSGGNRQGWRVMIIRDPQIRRRLAALCTPVFRAYRAQAKAGETPFNPLTESAVGAAEAAKTALGYPMLEHFDDVTNVPVVLVVALDLRVVTAFDKSLERIGVVPGASIYPFAWNILLAARNEGFGGVLTTFLAHDEPAAQEILGLPPHYAVAAMLPLGRPVKQLKKLTRNAVESFTTIDRFDGSAFSG